MAIGAHLAPKAALSLTQITSKEGKYDYITSASTKKKAYGRLCSHVKQNQKGKCNISEVSGFRGQWGGGVQGRTVGSRSPHVLIPVTQQRRDTGSLGTERHPLHGECSRVTWHKAGK